MTKKRKKKEPRVPSKSQGQGHAGGKDEGETADERRRDFGGLPDIDIKKNLGCG